jgi:anti-anti-sigma factor
MSIALVPPESVAARADAAPSSFACSCTDGGLDAAWVQVAGELDMATAPELEQTLCAARARARLVVLDLRELTFTDVSGLHAILDASISVSERDSRLVLVRAPPDVDRPFRLIRSCDELEVGHIDPTEPPIRAA